MGQGAWLCPSLLPGGWGVEGRGWAAAWPLGQLLGHTGGTHWGLRAEEQAGPVGWTVNQRKPSAFSSGIGTAVVWASKAGGGPRSEPRTFPEGGCPYVPPLGWLWVHILVGASDQQRDLGPFGTIQTAQGGLAYGWSGSAPPPAPPLPPELPPRPGEHSIHSRLPWPEPQPAAKRAGSLL